MVRVRVREWGGPGAPALPSIVAPRTHSWRTVFTTVTIFRKGDTHGTVRSHGSMTNACVGAVCTVTYVNAMRRVKMTGFLSGTCSCGCFACNEQPNSHFKVLFLISLFKRFAETKRGRPFLMACHFFACLYHKATAHRRRSNPQTHIIELVKRSASSWYNIK